VTDQESRPDDPILPRAPAFRCRHRPHRGSVRRHRRPGRAVPPSGPGHPRAPPTRRLLAQKPEAKGIAVAGMPMGSPGMEGPYSEPYDVVAFAHDGESWVFASVP